MLDYDTHSRLADATAELMRSCAVAAAQTMTASACRGLMLWSDMLRPPEPPSGAAGDPRDLDQSLRGVLALHAGGLDAESQRLARSRLLAAGSCARVSAGRPMPLGPRFADWSAWSRVYWPAWPSQPQQASPSRRAGNRDARRPQRGVALDLCQLPVRGWARRGAGHHAQRRYGGRRADRDEPRPHADAHHAQHMAHRARRLASCRQPSAELVEARLAEPFALRQAQGGAAGARASTSCRQPSSSTQACSCSRPCAACRSWLGRRRHPAAGRIGLARRLLGDGVALALGLGSALLVLGVGHAGKRHEHRSGRRGDQACR